MKVLKLKIPLPGTKNETPALSFFQAVVLIHQSEFYSELLAAAELVHKSSECFDTIDYGQLKQMITNHRNRINRK